MDPYKIVERSEYFEIIIDRDVDKDDLISTYYMLGEQEAFFSKHTLWTFKGDIQPLNYDDSKELIKLTKSSYPTNVPKLKNAFVCDSKFVRAAAEIYAKAASHMPFEIKVFDDYDQAVQWLTDVEQ
jgi:hypothetical protein